MAKSPHPVKQSQTNWEENPQKNIMYEVTK
jgi:hypothetical protein